MKKIVVCFLLLGVLGLVIAILAWFNLTKNIGVIQITNSVLTANAVATTTPDCGDYVVMSDEKVQYIFFDGATPEIAKMLSNRMLAKVAEELFRNWRLTNESCRIISVSVVPGSFYDLNAHNGKPVTYPAGLIVYYTKEDDRGRMK